MRDSKFWRIIAVATCGGICYVGYGLRHWSSQPSPSSLPPPSLSPAISERLNSLEREIEDVALAQGPRIEVLDSDWGTSSKPDVRAVCLSACSEIHRYLHCNRFPPIKVFRDGPN